MDGLTELALLFQERNNPGVPSITIGTVLNPPPEVKIKLNEVVVLEKDKLIFSAHMLNGYQRNIKFTDNNCGVTTTVNDGGLNASSHSHGIRELNVDTIMEWTDTIKKGDQVIIMPTMDEQLYVVIDKAVRL